MEAIREQKQQYLRDNILQANYDPNEFMDFCESEHSSVNIDLWSLNELKTIVQQFLRSKESHQQQPGSNNFNYDFNSDFPESNIGEYSQYAQKPQIKSPQKKEIDPSIRDQFNSWGNYISEPKVVQKKPQQQNFEFNLLDLDFLENLGGPNPKKVESEAEKSKLMTIPSDVAKKLQQGNSNFIVGYNPIIKESINNNSSPKKDQKPQSNIRLSQIGVISANINSANYTKNNVAQSSVSPPSAIANQGSNMKENFTENLKTKQVVTKSRLTGNEQVNITGHEIINPNIFVPKYVMYWVHINPLNIQVKRRFKDFQTLRQLLRKFFPSTQIPHLQRCSRLSETQPIIIQKQILFLESFINSLLLNKQLKCKLLQEFLLCPDLDLLKKFFKQYDKLAKPRAIEGLFTTEGTVEIKLNNQNKTFLQQQNNLSNYMEDHFTKVKNLYDQLTDGFQQSMKTLNQISELNSNFKTKIKEINVQFTPQYQCPDLQKVLDRMQYLHKQWSQSFKTQAKIIKTQIRHVYRYERANVKTLQQLLKTENDIQEAYLKRADRDTLPKQQYSSRRLQEFKLNIEVPSKNITVLRYQAGYFQQQCCQESLRFLRQLSKKFDERFKLFCQLQLSISHDMEGCWREFQKFYQ